jgi:hypothetical protein
LVRRPDRRTVDRRLADSAPQAAAPSRALGLAWSLEAVTDAIVATSDGSACARPGPVWHTHDKAAGLIPEGLPGVDRDADWIASTDQGWGYGDTAPVAIRVAPTTVRLVLAATVPGRACESQVWPAGVKAWPPRVRTWLLAAGDADGAWMATCAGCGIEVLAPLSKPVGHSTPNARRDRAA